LKRSILIIIFSFFNCLCFQSQVDSSAAKADSVALAKLKHKNLYSSPRKATILSTCFPGLGQIYNRKFWKLPIIYGAIGGLTYFFLENQNQYSSYRKAHIFSLDNNGRATVDGVSYLSADLQTQKFYYKKFRDFALIGIGIVYVIQIVDANVDAHLKTFDVSDDLSISIDPWHNYYNMGFVRGSASGLSIKLNFK
jgi:hypothetical protein